MYRTRPYKKARNFNTCFKHKNLRHSRSSCLALILHRTWLIFAESFCNVSLSVFGVSLSSAISSSSSCFGMQCLFMRKTCSAHQSWTLIKTFYPSKVDAFQDSDLILPYEAKTSYLKVFQFLNQPAVKCPGFTSILKERKFSHVNSKAIDTVLTLKICENTHLIFLLLLAVVPHSTKFDRCQKNVLIKIYIIDLVWVANYLKENTFTKYVFITSRMWHKVSFLIWV